MSESSARCAPSSGHGFVTTARLLCRPFETADEAVLRPICANPVVSRYVDDGLPLSAADTRRWINRSRRHMTAYGYGTGAVVLRATSQVIGWAGFARGADPTDLADEELLYGLDEPYWGMGLGTELLCGLVSYAQKELPVNRLRASVYRANQASLRLLQRQGFIRSEQNFEGVPGLDLYERVLSQ